MRRYAWFTEQLFPPCCPYLLPTPRCQRLHHALHKCFAILQRKWMGGYNCLVRFRAVNRCLTIGIDNSINEMSMDVAGALYTILYLQSAALENLRFPLMAVMGSLQSLFTVWAHRFDKYVCKWRLFATYIIANGGIIAWRGSGVMSRGTVEENTVKWMCSGGEMTSPLPLSPPSLPPSLTQTKCFLLNRAISLSLSLYHCLKTTHPHSPAALLSQSPCLIAFPLNHRNTAFPHFILVLIF